MCSICVNKRLLTNKIGHAGGNLHKLFGLSHTLCVCVCVVLAECDYCDSECLERRSVTERRYVNAKRL